MSATLSFVVLALATAGLASVATSAVTGASWRWLRSATGRLRPADRPLVWGLIALGPLAISVVVSIVAAVPSLREGGDHCLVHLSHHPHLCLRHREAIPLSPALVLVALFVPARLGASLVRAARSATLMARTMRSLGEAGLGGAHTSAAVFPADSRAAFVLGLVRPRVYASAGLVLGDAEVLGAVLAHERAHARRRDPLVRLLVSVVAAFHLPFLARAIERQVALSQELAADAEAARELGDPLRVADALLVLARERTTAGLGLAPAFTEGDLDARIHALLDPPAHAPARARWLGALGVALALACSGVSPDALHHGIETALGMLS